MNHALGWPHAAAWAKTVRLFCVMVLVVPIALGLWGMILPAFGVVPGLRAAGGASVALTLAPWRAVWQWPGLWEALWLAFLSGVGSTLIAFALSQAIVAALQGGRVFGLVMRLLAPMLALPHAAAALGLAFLIAPSGFLARLLSPWATGWQDPPDLLVLQDPWGLALMAGLVAKELPFLLLVTLAALGQPALRGRVLLAQSLGYGRTVGWFKTVFPAIYPQIRLPIYAVLAYAMTSVEMAAILGPTRPAPLAVQVVIWMGQPDLALRMQGAAAALFLLGAVLGALILWHFGARMVAHWARTWSFSGVRGLWAEGWLRGGMLAVVALGVVGMVVGLLGLTIWSFAGIWRFPDALPQTWSLGVWRDVWRGGGGLLSALGTTILIALGATLVGAILALAWLGARPKVAGTSPVLWLIYLPLIMPQVVFVPGLQTAALALGMQGGVVLVMATHVIFVFPYVVLSLCGPWQSWDPRLALQAAALGAGRVRIFWSLRLPMLLAALLTAAAVGFAVSVGQYLPTLLMGAGRVETLTTEAVALAAGGNRRLIGAYALAQIIVPVIGFAAAVILPGVIFANRRGMSRVAIGG